MWLWTHLFVFSSWYLLLEGCGPAQPESIYHLQLLLRQKKTKQNKTDKFSTELIWLLHVRPSHLFLFHFPLPIYTSLTGPEPNHQGNKTSNCRTSSFGSHNWKKKTRVGHELKYKQKRPMNLAGSVWVPVWGYCFAKMKWSTKYFSALCFVLL